MNPWQNPDGSDTQLMQLYKISQSGGLNPVQRTQYQQLLGNAGLPPNATPGSTPSSPSASTPTASNAVDLMKQAQQYQVQQNAPAIATLGSVQQSLPDQYAALLAEIKGAGTVATNYAIQGAGENLAARGITPDSALFNTTVGSAIAPIGLQYGGLEAQLGQGSVQTLTDLAGSIAALQAGNVPQAMNFGGNIAALQNALQIAQLQGTQRPYIPLTPGQTFGNVTTGQISLPTFANTGILK